MFQRTLWQYAFTEVIQRKSRSAGVAIGVALGIGLFVAIFSLADGYHRLVLRPFQQLKMDVAIQRSGPAPPRASSTGIRLPPANQPISREQVEAVKAFPEWEAVSRALVLWEHSAKGFTVICGVDTLGEDIGPSGVGEWVVKGHPLQQAGQVLLEKHFARVNRCQVGQTILMGRKPFTIVGLVELKPENAVSRANAYVSLEDARSLAELPPDSVNMLFARLKKGRDPETLQAKLIQVLPDARITTSDNIGQMMKGFGRLSGGFSKVLSGLSLLFAAFICYRLCLGSVYERRREIGVMKAVGWRNRDISHAVTMEAFLLGAAGGLAGITIGYGIAWILGSFEITLKMPWNLTPMPAMAANREAIRAQIPVVFSLKTSGLALVMSSIIGAATGALVSRKLAAIKPMEAIREI